MRFEFLGTGTSAGVPSIGCSCAVCTSNDPRDQRLRTSACLRMIDSNGQDRIILIDAGPDLRQQSLRAGLDRADAILITHNHVDHVFGLDEVRRFNVVMEQPIDLYTDTHTHESLQRVFKHIFDAKSNVQSSFVASLIGHTIEPGACFEVHGIRVEPIRLMHGRLPILGFRFDRVDGGDPGPLPLAYCTDVSRIPPETWQALTGLRTLVIDGLRHRKHPTHMSISQAVQVAEQVGADQSFLVHMSHEIGHTQTQAELPAGVWLAYDGLVLGQGVGIPDRSGG
jgi:phosphoribosyl 1,2-cyclic phosphate phosphodiesterase